MKPNLKPLIIILALFVPLALAQAFIVLPYEFGDENLLFAAVRYTAEYGRLPPPLIENTYGYRQQSGQPPLFYILGALVVAPFDTSDYGTGPTVSPLWAVGIPYTPDQFPYHTTYFNHPATDRPPYSGNTAALQALRVFNALVSAATLVFVYLAVYWAMPREWPREWLAAGAAAGFGFMVKYVALAGVARNDNLANLLGAAAIFVTVRYFLAEDADRSRPIWQRAALVGLLSGLGVLSKLTAGTVAAVLGLITVAEAWTEQKEGRWTRRIGVTAGAAGAYLAAAGLAFGWWPLRNWLLYRDPLMFKPHEHFNVHFEDVPWRGALYDLYNLGISTWSEVMWSGLRIPEWISWLYFVILGVALIGLVLFLWRRRTPNRGAVRRASTQTGEEGRTTNRTPLRDTAPRYGPAMALRMAILFTAMVAATIFWARDTGLTDGRFMYPALASVLILNWLGLGELFGPKGIKWLALASGGASYALAWGFLIMILLPANRMPLVKALPEGMRPLGWQAVGIELSGYDLPEGTMLDPGDDLTVRLYWTALEETDDTIVTAVQLGALANPQIVLAQTERLTGGTVFPTTEWRAGDLIAQDIRLRLPDEVGVPGLYVVRVALRPYDAFAEQPRLTLDGPNGEREPLVTLDRPVRILPPVEEMAHPVEVSFGELLTLRGWTVTGIEEGHLVKLAWQVQQTTSIDVTIFVHAFGPDGALVAQHDSVPVNGNFPAWAWQPGDKFIDGHLLPLSSLEGVRVLVGLYDPATGARLPVPGSAEGTYELAP